MIQPKITLHYDGVAPALSSALEELNALVAGRDLQLEVDFDVELRELFRHLFVGGRLEASKLIRLDSHSSALGAGDVLVSLHPSELLLELLAALRAGGRDGV